MKKVSIVIPVYNVSAYLSQCLDSVLGQTYPDLEILLIDDGSTDGSGQICEAYAEKDPRIHLVHQENAGAANAKNKGLDLAAGEYIAFVDSDDYAEPNLIEKMVTVLESADADAAECSFVREYIDRAEPGNPEGFDSCVFSGNEYMAQYLDKWTNSLFWNKLFKAELTTDVRFRRERRCIDDEFYTYKVIGAARKVVRIGEKLYHYRQRLSSAVFSQEKAFQRTEDALEIFEERYLWIGHRYPELKLYVLRHDISNLHYIAQKFPFSTNTVELYKRIARKYLIECFGVKSNWQDMKNAIKLSCYHKRELTDEKRLQAIEAGSGYFV